MAKFKFGVLIDPDTPRKTARMGNGAGTANPLSKNDAGKFLKLVGDSQYGLCAVGNEIEAVATVVDDIAPNDGYVMGALQDEGRVAVAFDGLQATPGTGTLAIGDYVVAGTPVALNTSLGGAKPKVCKATAAATALVFKWRVVALDGTGAVGQTGLIEFVG